MAKVEKSGHDILKEHRKAKAATKAAAKEVAIKNGSYKKSGPMSKAEREELIRLFQLGFDDIEIAAQMNRHETNIRNVRQKELLLGDDIVQDSMEIQRAVIELKKRPEWKQITQELMPDEFFIFEHEYGKIMSTLEDINMIEESSVFDLVKYHVLLHRNLKEKRRVLSQMDNIHKEIDKLLANINDKNREDSINMIQQLENQLNILRSCQQSSGIEYKNNSEKMLDIRKSLKSTRDQRISKLENSKRQSYIGLIVELGEEDVKRREGDSMKLVKAAVKKQEEMLGAEHQYSDGEWGRPILTSKTVKNGKKA
jgi:hypothetical protein